MLELIYNDKGEIIGIKSSKSEIKSIKIVFLVISLLLLAFCIFFMCLRIISGEINGVFYVWLALLLMFIIGFLVEIYKGKNTSVELNDKGIIYVKGKSRMEISYKYLTCYGMIHKVRRRRNSYKTNVLFFTTEEKVKLNMVAYWGSFGTGITKRGKQTFIISERVEFENVKRFMYYVKLRCLYKTQFVDMNFDDV